MIVGTIAGSLFSQFKTTALVDILTKKVDTVVHQVDNLLIGVYQTQYDIKQINPTLERMHTVLGKLIGRDQIYEHFFNCIYTTMLLDEQAEKFALAETAIDHLLMGKLHKGLIDPSGLKGALNQKFGR